MATELFDLGKRDFLKGLVMATVVPVLLIIQQSISAGTLVFNWQEIGMAAVSGLLGYLLKNFFTDDVKMARKIIETSEKKAIDNQNKNQS